MERWSKEWGMKLPEIIFGDNKLTVKKKGTNKQISVVFPKNYDNSFHHNIY